MRKQGKNERQARELAEARGYTIEVRDDGEPFEVLIECRHGHHFSDGVHERVFSSWRSTAGPRWDRETPRDIWFEAERFLREEPEPEPCDATCEWWETAAAEKA